MRRYAVAAGIFLAASVGSASSIASDIAYDELIRDSRANLAIGRTGDALRAAQRAVAQDAVRWEGYAVAGAALVAERRCREAVDYLVEAVAKSPEGKHETLKGLIKECASPRPSATPSARGATTPEQAEIVLWKTIEKSANPGDFRGYLERYPNGVFASVARLRAEQLEASANALKARQEEAEAKATALHLPGTSWSGELSYVHEKEGRIRLNNLSVSFGSDGQCVVIHGRGSAPSTCTQIGREVVIRAPKMDGWCGIAINAQIVQTEMHGTFQRNGARCNRWYRKSAWSLVNAGQWTANRTQ